MDGSGLLSQAMQSSRAEWKASESSGERGSIGRFGADYSRRVLRLLEILESSGGHFGVLEK